jgi:hypothetical protein
VSRARYAGLVLCLVLGACGGKGGSGVATAGGRPRASATPTPGVSIDWAQRELEYARCLREHGLNVADPGPGGKVEEPVPKNADEATTRRAKEALDACEHFIQDGRPEPTQSAPDLEGERKFAKCMRDHGFRWPDPPASVPPDLFDNPKVREVMDTCYRSG